MDALNSWDVALFAVAGYIAVVSLVRLMLGAAPPWLGRFKKIWNSARNWPRSSANSPKWMVPPKPHFRSRRRWLKRRPDSIGLTPPAHPRLH